MADVFISYASDDRARVEPLVTFFEGRGWSVWWDRSINAGDTWPKVIERELNHARCVVVAWSKQSVASPWVRLEAHRARERRNLIPVLLDSTPLPAEYATYQTFDMRADGSEGELDRLGDSVAAQLRRRARRRASIVGGAIAAIALLAASTTCWVTERCSVGSPAAPVMDATFAVVASEMKVDDGVTAGIMEAFVDDVRRSLRRAAVGKVSSRAETSAIPDGASSIDLGKRLRVRYLLALSIGGKPYAMSVLAELIDTSTGYLVDDWRLDGSIARLNTLNAMLVRSIVRRFVDDIGAVAIAANEPGEAYARYLEGRAALREGSNEAQLAKAEAIFDAVLERWPEFARADAALCQVDLLRYETSRAPTQFAAAEQHCRRALEVDADSGEAAVALGQLNLMEGRPRQAAEAFERALDDLDTVADARVGLGDVAAAESRNDDAEREYRLAIEAEPAYWRTYTALGNFLFRAGRGGDALVEHRNAASLAKHDGVALNNIGAALFLSGQLEAALGAWLAALELGPQAPTYSNLGAAYYLLGDFARAVTMYERSVALVGDDYRVWTNLADARAFDLREDADAAYRTAARLIERELERNPGNALARVGLASVKAALHELDAAAELERALENAGDNDWQFNLTAAVTEFRLGRLNAARVHLEAAVRAGYPKLLIELDPALRDHSVANDSSTRRR